MKFRLATLFFLGAFGAALGQDMGSGINNPASSSSAGGPPTGAAGGDLGGTYPNPTVTNGSHITNASIPNSGLATPAPCTAFGTAAGTCAQGGAITAGGPTGSATVAPIITYNAAGQLTTVSSATITPAVGSITGLGTGVATALGSATNATGGPAVTVTGCTAWTPTDQSGASLTFTSVSAMYCQVGNMVYAYGTLTYPSTASGSNALISLPVPVPNQPYAAVSALSGGAATSITIRTVINSSTAAFFTSGAVQSTNLNLTLQVLHFILIYPAS